MVYRHRASVSRKDNDEATVAVIGQLVRENDDCVVTVDESEVGESEVISLTTRHMRELYSRLPELLLVNCTHKTNRYVLALCLYDQDVLRVSKICTVLSRTDTGLACAPLSYNYQFCTFMIMDEFGEGQVVQQSLLEANTDWHVQKAVDHF